jgi:hypothetical protein
MPISWRGTLQQYVGRLHRLHEGKKTVQVYDYVDSQVPVLAHMYDLSYPRGTRVPVPLGSSLLFCKRLVNRPAPQSPSMLV